MELKYGRNEAGGAEISKIRHLGPKRRLGPKQHCFGALGVFFFFFFNFLFLTQGITQNNVVLIYLKRKIYIRPKQRRFGRCFRKKKP